MENVFDVVAQCVREGGEGPMKAVELLLDYTSAHPTDPKGWFELAGVYDLLGMEEEALLYYERVGELGVALLPLLHQPRFYLQMGSTLRNLRRFDDAKRCFIEGVERFPEHRALRAFQSLVSYSSGRLEDAVKELFSAILHCTENESIKEYRRALTAYVDDLHKFPLSHEGELHHIELYVSDLSRTVDFWGWLLESLGYKPFQEWHSGRSWRLGDSYIVFVQAEERFLDLPYHRCRPGINHLAFHARSKEHVDDLRERLRDRGAHLLYDERYPHAGGTSYAVFFEDPDRMKVEIVASIGSTGQN